MTKPKASDRPKKPRSIKPATRLKGLAIFVALLVIAYGGIWFSVADEAEERVRAAVTSLRDKGYEARFGSVETGGFPYRLTVTINDLSLGLGNNQLAYMLTTPQLVIITHPWTLGDWNLNAADLTVVGETGSGAKSTLRSPAARASLRRPTTGPQRLVVDFGQSSLSTPGYREARLVAQALQLSLRWNDPDGDNDGDLFEPKLADLAVRALDVTVAPELTGTLGRRIAELELISEVTGDSPPIPTRPALLAWQNSGGTLEISKFTLKWGAFDMTADGSLTVDEELEPLGAITTTTRGSAEAIRHLAKLKVITPSRARVATEALSLLETTSEKGRQLNLPLTMQGGQLTLGALPIAEVGSVLP